MKNFGWVMAGAVASLAVPAFAWEGHQWEKWREVSTWVKPEVKSEQAGKKRVTRLLATSGDEPATIDEIKVWEKRRSKIADVISKILGEPTNLKVPAVKVEVLGEETLDDHIRRHIRIKTEPDDWIPAYLLVPTGSLDSPRPAMVCLHQTQAPGKDEACGITGNSDLAFALQLVRRGYVCIAPDAIGFGERIPSGTKPYHDSIAFYRKHPNWSYMGKMNWDVSRVIDYLETLTYVDKLQIGCIGHSHGAYGSLFAAAFEPRISLVIASCGFNTFRDDPDPNRWSHLTALIPQIGAYLPDVASIPFDWHQLCALIAPRPLFCWYATEDTIFPNTRGLDVLFKDMRTVYGLYGAADDLAWHAFEGKHCFPSDGRKLAYQWLQDRLFTVGDIRKMPSDVQAWEKQSEMIKRVVRRTIGAPTLVSPPFDVKTFSVEQMTGYERRLIEYSVDIDDRVKAYLCIPKNMTGLVPGVLVLHQTTAFGKREAVGIDGKKSLAFGHDLAERGYITLSPDSITAGERIDQYRAFDTRGHYLRHPNISAMGKMLYDAQRALDLLAQTEGVDLTRLGAIGHSLGAEEALMLAAFDDRIKAAVSSCGYATFKADEKRMCWARDRWFSYMPKLRHVFLQGRLPHWDWGDVLKLVAPRAFYQHTTKDDEIFLVSESAHEAGEAARPIWELYGQPDKLANVLKPGKHAIADDTRADMYQWFDKHLAGK